MKLLKVSVGFCFASSKYFFDFIVEFFLSFVLRALLFRAGVFLTALTRKLNNATIEAAKIAQ